MLLGRHRQMIYNAAYQVLHDWALSEDVVQATAQILATKAEGLLYQDSLAGWLHRVALDCARDLRKAESRRQSREDQAARLKQANRKKTDLEGPMLQEALEWLPERYRRPITLHYLEGYPQAEAADMLGITETAFAVRCLRAREALREWLLRHDPAWAFC